MFLTKLSTIPKFSMKIFRRIQIALLAIVAIGAIGLLPHAVYAAPSKTPLPVRSKLI